MLLVLLILACVFSLSLILGYEVAYSLSNKVRVNLETPSSESRVIAFLFSSARDVYSSLWLLFIILFLCYQSSFFCLTSLYAFALPLYAQIAVSIIGSSVLLFLVLDLVLRLVFKFNPFSVVGFLSYPTAFFVFLFKPISIFCRFANRKSRWRMSVNGILSETENSNFGTESNESSMEDYEEEVKMFRNALDFSNVLVKDCMVPRTEIVSIDVESSVDELKSLLVESNYSRIVVYKDNIDNVLGYVHSQDMFDLPHEIKDMLNPLPVVQEKLTANRMLKIFLQQHKGMALVVDEFGGTSGIITLEDIMEEIFGEIEDEHDSEDSLVAKRLSKNEYVLSGRLEIDEVNERFGLAIPVSDDYTTIGGYILSNNLVLPKMKEVVKIGKFQFMIVKVSSTKIDVVKLKILEENGSMNK